MALTIDITYRVGGSPLTPAEMDTNLLNLKNGVLALEQILNVSLDEDGTLLDGSVDSADAIVNNIITLNKLLGGTDKSLIAVKDDAGTLKLEELTGTEGDYMRIGSDGHPAFESAPAHRFHFLSGGWQLLRSESVHATDWSDVNMASHIAGAGLTAPVVAAMLVVESSFESATSGSSPQVEMRVCDNAATTVTSNTVYRAVARTPDSGASSWAHATVTCIQPLSASSQLFTNFQIAGSPLSPSGKVYLTGFIY